jgi:hypothetical protein
MTVGVIASAAKVYPEWLYFLSFSGFGFAVGLVAGFGAGLASSFGAGLGAGLRLGLDLCRSSLDRSVLCRCHLDGDAPQFASVRLKCLEIS